MIDICKSVMDVKLLVIISDDHVGETESINDRSLEEPLDLDFDDSCQGFYLYSFGEVVNGDEKELSLTRCWKRWIKYVHFSLSK